MKKINVLVVDDEWKMRNLIRIYLSKNGFDVIEAKDGHEALAIAKNQSLDLIILDIMMPDLDGWEVCRKIRETSLVPILMLTARADTKDKVQGLTIGADDYLIKPFEPEELIARVQALLRRTNVVASSDSKQTIVSLTGLSIDPERRMIKINGSSVDFTPKEFDLLYFLARHSEQVFNRDHLLLKIWGDEYFGDNRTVDTHVKSIRGKLKRGGLPYQLLHTVWGVGYKLKGLDE